jgi:serine/threonine protein phosphatase 1
VDLLTYAIGDVHGRHDLLLPALDWVERHARGGPAKIVLLGDYIDRGPSSREVVETLIRGPAQPNLSFTCLMGNHEAMLLASLDDPSWRWNWLANGGDITLKSYGGKIPEEHIGWMRSLPLRVEDEHRHFVHAGFNPYLELDAQTPDDLLWIREPFVSGDFDFGKHVVHGHTPQANGPDLRRHRSNLDVGAFWTGRLCVAVFDPACAGGPVETVLIQAR